MRTIFLQFVMGDIEDPELYSAGPIWDWQQTEYGKWCMENATEKPSFLLDHDYNSYGYRCTVYGNLTEQDFVFHQLKWRGNGNFNHS